MQRLKGRLMVNARLSKSGCGELVDMSAAGHSARARRADPAHREGVILDPRMLNRDFIAARHGCRGPE